MKYNKIFRRVAAAMLASLMLLPGMTVQADTIGSGGESQLVVKGELASGENVVRAGDNLVYVTVTNEDSETAIGVSPNVTLSVSSKGGFGTIKFIDSEEKVDIPAGASHVFEVNLFLEEDVAVYWALQEQDMEPLEGETTCFFVGPGAVMENDTGVPKVREGVSVSIAYDNEPAFSDVRRGDWYFNSVEYVNYRGMMTGLDENNFGPTQNLARAQFAVILYRMEGEPEVEYKDVFPDVADGQWYTDAIMWANQMGIVTGYADSGLFGFADDINREQMAVMMHRYAQYKGYNVTPTVEVDFSKFTDSGNLNAFAQEAMRWAIGTRGGIIRGKDGGTRIDPQGNASRAECATIIQRFVITYGM